MLETFRFSNGRAFLIDLNPGNSDTACSGLNRSIIDLREEDRKKHLSGNIGGGVKEVE